MAGADRVSGRPEVLFPLFADIGVVPGIGPKTALLLANIDITRPRDVLFTLPTGVIDRRIRQSVRGAVFPSVITVEVKIGLHQPGKTKTAPYRIFVQDALTEFQLVFFHPRAEWLRQQFPAGQRRIISGRVELFDGIAQMTHPDYVLRPDGIEDLPEYEPVYPLTAGVTQKVMGKAVAEALQRAPTLREWIDPSVRATRGWPDWKAALVKAHGPKSDAEISPLTVERSRLAYDELFAHQLTLAIARDRFRRVKGFVTKGDGELSAKVLASLPYRPTAAQTQAIAEITADMAAPLRMSRLLQGDVGSGKTLVAFMAMLVAVEAGGQAAMMAPTEILARQHYESLRPLAELAGVKLMILTGRDKGLERGSKLVAFADGTCQIAVGTHALFQRDVEFAALRLAVVDEQHRFGVHQRMELTAKGEAVDVLVMTATPIPRSLTLAQYGDMDLSILYEKPPGRKPVQTALISNGRLDEVVDHLRKALAEGRQAYWVCPLVEESETVELTAAVARFEALKLALGAENVGLVHGQLPPSEKDAAMAAFQLGHVKLLVATTVIEVGVDVPNASIMVIEGAEHFGLAQLHQLRGRVGRGEAASTCLMIYDAPLGDAAMARLSVMRETEDGFRIAEEDLRLRGAGDLLGVQQSGLPKFRIADVELQADLMKAAQDDARFLLHQDPELKDERGQAARVLLYLMDKDRDVLKLQVG